MRAQAEPLAELTSSDRARANREALAAEAQAKQAAECTFKPRLLSARARSRADPAPDGSSGGENRELGGGLIRRIAAYGQRRQAELEQQRAKLHAQELRECTFAPALAGPAPASQVTGVFPVFPSNA